MFKFFPKNLTAKILALLFAVSLWIYVVGVSDKIGDFPAKIQVIAKNVPAQMAIATDLPQVELKIKAPYVSWEKLTADSFSCYIDLAGFSAGEYELNIEAFCTDSEVVILEKNPSKVKVRLDKVALKEVPVEVKFEGKPGEGYVVTDSKVLPEKVEIRGAQSILDNILSVYAIVYLNGEMSKVQRKAELAAFNTQGNKINNLTIQPESVDVVVLIQKASNIKTVGVKVNISGLPDSRFWISKIVTEPATLSLTGKAETIQDIEYIQTEEIDITGITRNSTFIVGIVVPSDISVVGGTNKVQVTIYLTSNEISKVIPATIGYRNGSGSTEDVVKVIVSGPLSILGRLNSSSVIVTVDLSGKDSGIYDIDIPKSAIRVPTNVNIIDFSPKTIKVIVQ